MPPKLDLPDGDIVQLYADGLTQLQIAKRIGVSEPTIRKRLIRAGVAIRNKTGAAKARIQSGLWACRVCKAEKPLTAYEMHTTRTGNQYPVRTCYECKLRRARDHSHSEGVRERRLDRVRGYNRTPKAIEQRRSYRLANAEQLRIIHAAGEKVRRAVRSGRLSKPSACEQCGDSSRVDAAHSDYSKPLDVRWLCVSCHNKWDHQIPKILGDRETVS